MGRHGWLHYKNAFSLYNVYYSVDYFFVERSHEVPRPLWLGFYEVRRFPLMVQENWLELRGQLCHHLRCNTYSYICRTDIWITGEIGAFPPSLGRRNPPIQSWKWLENGLKKRSRSVQKRQNRPQNRSIAVQLKSYMAQSQENRLEIGALPFTRQNWKYWKPMSWTQKTEHIRSLPVKKWRGIRCRTGALPFTFLSFCYLCAREF